MNLNRDPVQLQAVAKFRMVDGDTELSCDDLPGYDFILTEEECKEAMEYMRSNNTVPLSPAYDPLGIGAGRWRVLATDADRPLGCYYFPAGDKVIHPSNMCKTGSCAAGERAHDIGGTVKTSALSSNRRKQICVSLASKAPPTDTTTPTPTDTTTTTPTDTTPTTPPNDIVIDTVAPTVVPFCQWNRGTIKGDKIVTEKKVFSCPETTTIYCPDGYTVDDMTFTTGCEWKDQNTPAPLANAPEPKCQPNVARTVYKDACQPTDITTEKCAGDIPCEMKGDSCFCPDGIEKIEVTCNATEETINNVTGRLECGEYGVEYELTCPDGYLLNKGTQLCEKIATRLQSL